MMGAPVSLTSWPRTNPSVASIEIVRTVFSPTNTAPMDKKKDRKYGVVDEAKRTQVLGDLEDQAGGAGGDLDLQGVEDGRQGAVELHVHDGTDDLRHHAALHRHAGRVAPRWQNEA